MNPPVRVVKVGGSLLNWSGLTVALPEWLARQSAAVHVLVAGGGEFAEAIRRADRTHGLGEEVAHWLCVDALSVTARLLGAAITKQVIARENDLPTLIPAVCIFDPAPFLRTIEPDLAFHPLPHTWAVTSDSIAARIALHFAATELVLLKSCLPRNAAADYLDDFFSTATATIAHIRCVNLRSRDFEEITWVSPP